MNYFAQTVLKDTDGTVKLTTYNNSQLGPQPEALGELRSGSVQVVGGTSILDSIIPQYDVLSMPYLFPSLSVASEVANSKAVRTDLFDKFSSHGITILPGIWVGGFGSVLSTVPLSDPHAFKGLKWRVPSSVVGQYEGHALGADPISLEITEVFSSLETHALQAVSDPTATYISEKWYQAAKYVNELDDIVYLLPLAVSNQFWNKLTSTQQAEVDTAALATATYADQQTANDNAAAINELKKSGLTIIQPNKSAISAAVKPGLPALAQQIGGNSLYQAVQSEIGADS